MRPETAEETLMTVLPDPRTHAGTTVVDPPVPAVDDVRWDAELRRVLARPELLTLHPQPIAELSTGQIAGFEVLSRFDASRIVAPPDVWFAAADHFGHNAELQSRVLATAVDMRDVLPPNTFLTVNIEPHLLLDDRVNGTLFEHADLSRLVVELTEHTRAGDPRALRRVLDRLRERGGLVAMDDAGTGYAGLSQLLHLTPDIVKIDRELVHGIDTDPVKRSLMEVLGDLVGRMDGWLLAEGIETPEELDTVVGLGVALGQGFALARPAVGLLPQLTDDVVQRIRTVAGRTQFDEHVLSIVRSARVGTDPATCDVLLDADARIRAVRTGGTTDDLPLRWVRPLLVAPSASLAEVARRAANRHPADLGAPLVCTDGQGRVVGIVLHSDLLLALAR
ncbi:EAL domain-containing protein [Kineococcus sp. NBC_00420]|uniref:EAL domain-containing protein n=1 Tax=Kineococcus sp. NBC_00420 TaxID=2903564 RepID=UPI002E1C1694